MTRVWTAMVLCAGVIGATGCGDDEDGEPSCTATSGCSANEYCALDLDLGSLMSGELTYHCTPRAKLGATCEHPPDHDVNTCQEGAYCAYTEELSDLVCKPAVAMGAECPGFDSGPFVCAESGVCTKGDDGTRTCQPGGKEGASCSFGSSECSAGFFCSTPSGQPSRCTARLQKGGVCEPDSSICMGSGGSLDRCTYFSDECALGLNCRMTQATECAVNTDCDLEKDEVCCVTDSGTECRAGDPARECKVPTGTCGP